ncbi:nose resistant to fluoxetine protein 6-like [Anoplophora glabripennis]|uniref:nose resistant to fluoxetine protein 6-like n=1 Tax=Anoplophora glabripennis TaxID=217634 RepID=UPI000C792244|nr:nose resistant to fluoxetine protein 6-like [Anoplophora glabripennis]
MGDFEQCITAKAPFQTQYCLASVTAHVPKPTGIKDHLSLNYQPYLSAVERLYKFNDVSQQTRNVIDMGWCVPASCSILDLEEYLNGYLNKIDNNAVHQNVTYTARFSDLTCRTAIESKYFDNADISFCFVAVILIVMVIIGTAYDYNVNSKELKEKPSKRSLASKLIMAFSSRKNFLELTKADESNPALSVLYGVRTVAIFAIIMSHRFATFTSSAILNFDFVESQYRSPAACIIFHGDVFVDSFFILSGLLVVYGLLNQYDKRRTNPGLIVVLRYIRLTPVYAFVIFYYATIFAHVGDGPLWKVIAGEDSKDCRKNWWLNFLYLNNYINTDHICMAHSWYLPCDFHYFIIATFVCLLVKKDKKLGLGSMAAITIASVVVPFVITIVYERPALLHFYPEFLTGPKIHPDFQLTYTKTHTRGTPYCIGMFTGYIYYKLKGSNKHVCRTQSFAIVMGSLFLMLVSLFSGMVFYDPYHSYNSVESAAYAALHRPAWALGSVGLIYVASFGHGSFLKKVLSWSPWIPLSKLVYGAYLTHFQFQLRSAAVFKNPKQIAYFDVFALAVADAVLAFVAALVLYLMIEAPFRKIFRELMFPSKDSTPKVVAEHPTMEENMINNNNNNNNNNCQDSRL